MIKPESAERCAWDALIASVPPDRKGDYLVSAAILAIRQGTERHEIGMG
jgi:hypothetical protein